MTEVKVPFMVGNSYATLSLHIESGSSLEEADLLASIQTVVDDVDTDLRRREKVKRESYS